MKWHRAGTMYRWGGHRWGGHPWGGHPWGGHPWGGHPRGGLYGYIHGVFQKILLGLAAG